MKQTHHTRGTSRQRHMSQSSERAACHSHSGSELELAARLYQHCVHVLKKVLNDTFCAPRTFFLFVSKEVSSLIFLMLALQFETLVS